MQDARLHITARVANKNYASGGRANVPDARLRINSHRFQKKNMYQGFNQQRLNTGMKTNNQRLGVRRTNNQRLNFRTSNPRSNFRNASNTRVNLRTTNNSMTTNSTTFKGNQFKDTRNNVSYKNQYVLVF